MDCNRNGDFLGGFLRVKVSFNVFQLLRQILILCLPNGARVTVDLLYEKLLAYYFLCGSFNHLGPGSHLYKGVVIEATNALYGSWLQAEVRLSNRNNHRGRRYGLDEDERFVDSDDD